jgi:TRAP-type C4-dicarboxylate transport system substrate-binding protein
MAIADPPITLRLAVADGLDAPAVTYVNDLVQRVATLSAGKITMVPTIGAGGSLFEEGVLHQVISGDTELGLVGSRSLDLVGETSLVGLQAPFLIDSEAVARGVAEGPVGKDGLAALDSVVGLALWPEDVRHIASFQDCGRDLRTPAGMKGTTFLVQPSNVLHDALDALGAVPYETLKRDRNIDAESCTLQALELGLDHAYAAAMGSHPIALADVILYAKFQTLIANPASLDRLSDAQEAALRAAVADVAKEAIENSPIDAKLAEAFCAEGGSIINAGAGAQKAYRDAVASVYAKLEANPQVKAQIDAIGTLESKTPAGAGTPVCEDTLVEKPNPSLDVTGYVGTTFPDGTFRRELVPNDLIAAGVDPQKARDNEQVLTYVFDHGNVTFRWDAIGSSGECRGTYASIDGKYVEMKPAPGFEECGIGPRSLWREEPGGISFVTLDPTSNADDHLMLDHWVWTRIH